MDSNKIEIIPNGINPSEYQNLPDKGTFKNKYGIESNTKIILYLGRIHKNKGVDLLVDTFYNITKELDDVKLVLIGPNDGNQQLLVERIQKLKINNKVLFTGFVTNEDKIAAFVDADIFVTPSFSGFPVTFLEACACGTPIITTDKGDKLDWIDNNTGYVVGYDKKQLHDAMIKILTGESIRMSFGITARELAINNFSWNSVVEKMEEIYYLSI